MAPRNGNAINGTLSSYIGRDSQYKQLSLLLSGSQPSPPVIVVHGPEASGKTGVVTSFLESSRLLHVILQCRECITARHMFERVVAQCYTAILDGVTNGEVDDRVIQRCENISAFTVALSSLISGSAKTVIVLDGIDELRDAPPSLMPAVARIGELIPNLTMLLIVRYPTPRSLRTIGVPHIYFPPYNREQASAILALNPLDIFPAGHQVPEGYTDEEAEADNLWLWSRFCQAVWDALAKGAANDLISFRTLCERLWRPFVQPILDGTFGTRDFSRLVVYQRKLLQEDSCMEDNLIVENESQKSKHVVHEFPYFSKWILCAAYLASYNPIKTDTTHFMKATERKRKKKGGGTAVGRQSKSRKIPRHLLSPSAFTLDRLLAILHAILPHDYTPNIDIFTQVATLAPLRLLLRSGMYSSDPLDRGAKWRVNYDWDYILKMARSINFDITDYVAD